MTWIQAREQLGKEEKQAFTMFGKLMNQEKNYDYQYSNVQLHNLIIIGDFDFPVPALKELYKDNELASYFDHLSAEESHLFQIHWDKNEILYYAYSQEELHQRPLDSSFIVKVLRRLDNYKEWAGLNMTMNI